MISGKQCDLLDSQEFLLRQSSLNDNEALPNAEDTFDDLWCSPELLPYKDDVDKFVKGNSLFDELNFGNDNDFHPSTSKGNVVDSTRLEGCHSTLQQVSDTQSNMHLEVSSTCWTNEQSCSIASEGNVASSHVSSGNIFSVCSKASSDNAGAYGFSVRFVKLSEVITKSMHYTYSGKLNKLFVQNDQVCPIQFKCDVIPPIDSVVKIMARFKSSEFAATPVKPCVIHNLSATENPLATDHLIQIFEPRCNATYNITEEGQRSVSFVFQRNNEDSDFQTMRFKFPCLSSCKSGINRRAVEMIFQLESADGAAIGRQAVDLCICTRPGRDRLREENKPAVDKKRKLKRQSSGLTPAISSEPSAKMQKDTDEVYVMIVHGKRKYEKLFQIKQAFDLAELVDDEQRDKYLRNEANH